MSFDKMLAAYDAEWEGPIRKAVVVANEYMTVDDYIKNGRKMLAEYYEKHQPFDQGRLLGAEMRLNFELPHTRFGFLAIVDRLWKRPDGTIEIWDYKTGRRLPLGSKDPSFRRQMGLYQIAIQTIYPEFERIELAQYWLRHDEVISCQLRTDEIEELLEELRTDVHAIINAERLNDFPTREGPLCSYCDYEHLCPAKRHRLMLDAESGNGGGGEKATAESGAELADRFIKANEEMNRWKQEREALRKEVIQAARELEVDTLCGSATSVRVKLKSEECLPTKSQSPDEYAELSHLAGKWGFENYFELSTSQFMKEAYRKGRLTPEQQEQIKAYVRIKDASRVSIVKRKNPENE